MSIPSENIVIFPCVSRTYDTNETAIKAKLMSEENITNIIKSVTDKKSYVIGYSGDKFLFVLDGYYVELKASKSGTLYAYMEDKISSGNHTLIKGDDGGQFMGIGTSATDPGKSNQLCLLLNGEIPKESLSKFNAYSLPSSMDFGELN